MNNSNQKKLLFYTDTPYVGGAENQMYLLAKFLDKEKYDIILVCSDYKKLDEWSARFEREGVRIVRLTVAHKHDPRHYFQLKVLLKSEIPDIVHLHVWNPASCRYGFMAANKYRFPVVVTEHDPFELPKLKKYIKNKLMKRVQKIVTVSDSNYELMQKLFPELKNRTMTIHNGIDTTWFESQLLNFSKNKRTEFRGKEFEADAQTKVILTVAELHERKGLKHLIKTMHKILAKNPNTRLIIAGEGPQKKELTKLINEENLSGYVRLLGYRKDIPQIMASSDVFVLPSEKEAFGLVLLEAMTAKLPIVASNVGGIPEIIEDGITGDLIEPSDHDLMAEKILEFFNDNFKVREYTEAGYDKLKSQFDAKTMAKKYDELYDKIINGKS
jgi:glycosyltransferase involved in cell wall biosynthesis